MTELEKLKRESEILSELISASFDVHNMDCTYVAEGYEDTSIGSGRIPGNSPCDCEFQKTLDHLLEECCRLEEEFTK